jgi:hypothetical protein
MSFIAYDPLPLASSVALRMKSAAAQTSGRDRDRDSTGLIARATPPLGVYPPGFGEAGV